MATVTSTLTGSGTISPSGATTVSNGQNYTLTITPSSSSDIVTVTNNGTDVTSSLVSSATAVDRVLGTYTLISGGFNGSGATFFSGRVGKGFNATTTSTNYYSSGSGTRAIFQYDMSFTNIPSNAVIHKVYVKANAHPESTSNANEYMCIQLKSGGTALSEQYNWKSSGSTSNTTYTLECTTIPTVSQLSTMVLECTLGYYGGALNGATAYVEYSTSGLQYTYTFQVNGNATIAVTIGAPSGSATMYIKLNGTWTQVTAVYKKVNGTWVQQTDLTNVFTSGTNYHT